MAQTVKLGGERLGSGNSMKQELYNYGMNSFNQGRDWKSTMAPGVLYPCFKEIGTNHGTFDIDIDTFVRTLPTKGPLFGAFKMQVDLFNVPFRLYQGVLHNNPVDIGLNMNKVLLPDIEIGCVDGLGQPRVKGANEDSEQVCENALIKYLGISGIGHHVNYDTEKKQIKRNFQCVPVLGYYDIFKNYYSNKQEENAYVITPGTVQSEAATAKIISVFNNNFIFDNNNIYGLESFPKNENAGLKFTIEGGIEDTEEIEVKFCDGGVIADFTLGELITDYETTINLNEEGNTEITIKIYNVVETTDTVSFINITGQTGRTEYTADIHLEPFALKNIDKMRAKLLRANELESKVGIVPRPSLPQSLAWGTNDGVDATGLPYVSVVQQTTAGISWNAFSQNGLVVKTYQSDLFNNWLDNSMVETISQRTMIDTSEGGFTPDTLILQEKIYKYLNRILVSGGTYYDWQEATYGEGVARMCEIPMYIGGMSSEIMFEEVINNSANEAGGKYQALGSLGGKGTQVGRKGGQNIHVRMDEPGYIIGIVSITPRISVCQGNDWDMTEIKTMDDLHKPELDGIGFQDLMVEQMAWWNTKIDEDGETILNRDAVGKQTAWINYQTAVDKVYGDFAKAEDGYAFMVLNRAYEHVEDDVWGVKDITTYIDPAKFNYAFAYTDLAAQNFWVQLNFKVTSRRKMGAQQLPNL